MVGYWMIFGKTWLTIRVKLSDISIYSYGASFFKKKVDLDVDTTSNLGKAKGGSFQKRGSL